VNGSESAKGMGEGAFLGSGFGKGACMLVKRGGVGSLGWLGMEFGNGNIYARGVWNTDGIEAGVGKILGLETDCRPGLL